MSEFVTNIGGTMKLQNQENDPSRIMRNITGTALMIVGIAATQSEPVYASWSISTGCEVSRGDRNAELCAELQVLRHDEKINDAAFDAALTFIDFIPYDIGTPGLMSEDDGEVVFYWRDPGQKHIEVGFPGDGTISYYAFIEGRPEVSGDVEFDGQSFPRELLDALALS